jgi:DNA-binding transcriptional regulator YiaG
MTSSFTKIQQYAIVTCYKCSVPFGMTQELQEKRRSDGKSFWCPNGHEQHYTGGKTAKQLREELEKKNEEIQRGLNRQHELEREVQDSQRKHRALRTKIFNGKCPCCDQVFDNVLQHMHAQHADYMGEECTMAALREMFSMSQTAVAMEAHVNPAHVSLYERGKSVPAYAKERLEGWVQQYIRREVVENESVA